MENFIVSARKYRPSNFNTVVGQKAITSTLKNAIKNKQLAQAFLFCGPRGVGKTTCARILAKTINCQNPTDDMEPCNECSSCTNFNESASFNVHELDAASNNSVEGIRSLIDQVRIPPQNGRYKVYIIDEVHMLSQSAFNAFLKTLEEPPAYAKFILATTEKHKILPTILSRCQIYDFKRITISDIAQHLKYVAGEENINAEPDGIHVIAEKADGALRDALSIFDQIVNYAGKNFKYEDVIENLNVLDYDYYFKLVDHILKQQVSDILLLLSEIIDNGFDAHHFINGLGNHLRNLLVCKDPSTVKLLEVGDMVKNKYLNQSKEVDILFLMKALDISNQCDIDYKAANNKRLHVEIALLQITSLINNPNSGQKKNLLAPLELLTQSNLQAPQKQEQKNNHTAANVKNTLAAISHSDNKQKTASKPVVVKGLRLKGTAATLEKKLQKPEEQKKIPVSQQKTDILNTPKIPKEEIKDSWNAMIQDITISDNIRSTLKATELKWNENTFTITISALNTLNKQSILNEKEKILHYLRKKHNTGVIQLEVNVTKQQIESKPYGPKDKFAEMVRKNPSLQTFKNKLHLEIEL